MNNQELAKRIIVSSYRASMALDELRAECSAAWRAANGDPGDHTRMMETFDVISRTLSAMTKVVAEEVAG